MGCDFLNLKKPKLTRPKVRPEFIEFIPKPKIKDTIIEVIGETGDPDAYHDIMEKLFERLNL